MLRLILRQGVVLTLIGVGIGLGVGALCRSSCGRCCSASARSIQSPSAEAPRLFVAVALAASYGPARRATDVDPDGGAARGIGFRRSALGFGGFKGTLAAKGLDFLKPKVESLKPTPMSRLNGDKSRHQINRKRVVVRRAKDQEAGAKTQKAKAAGAPASQK